MTLISDGTADRLLESLEWPDLAGTSYEIEALIGRGGMGAVYRAWDSKLERPVAIKVLTADWLGPRLAQEARILARLDHPGIVPVHDLGTLPDGRWYYVMKLVEGERLDRWIASGLVERLRLFEKLCDAVAYAHAAGIVHRDLKPENIMVGAFGELFVLDWGVATVAGEPDGFRAGTPGFMSPEQEAGGPIDPRTDIYALGAILDRLITPSGRQLALAAIGRQAQAPDPAHRYQTVGAMQLDIRAFLAGRAVSAHAEPPIQRLVRIARAHRTPILIILSYIALRFLFAFAQPG